MYLYWNYCSIVAQQLNIISGILKFFTFNLNVDKRIKYLSKILIFCVLFSTLGRNAIDVTSVIYEVEVERVSNALIRSSQNEKKVYDLSQVTKY